MGIDGGSDMYIITTAAPQGVDVPDHVTRVEDKLEAYADYHDAKQAAWDWAGGETVWLQEVLPDGRVITLESTSPGWQK